MVKLGGGSQFDSSNYSEMAGIDLDQNSSDELNDDQKENPNVYYQSTQERKEDKVVQIISPKYNTKIFAADVEAIQELEAERQESTQLPLSSNRIEKNRISFVSNDQS